MGLLAVNTAAAAPINGPSIRHPINGRNPAPLAALCIRTTPASVLRSAIPIASIPWARAVSTSSIASDAPRRKEKGVVTPSST